MELIKEIWEHEIIEGKEFDPDFRYKVRKAARAIIIGQDNKIPLVYASRDQFHKIPGGGIEPDEDIETGLRREVLEESGCEIENIKPIGIIIEYRNKFKQVHINYCFLADLKGQPKDPEFTDKEKEEGFKVTWTDIEEGLALFKKDQPRSYLGEFVKVRDCEFLKKAKEIITRQ